jgi:thiopurine S-methyltransferase
MDPTFWLDRWASSQTGFHMDQPHPDLLAESPSFLAGGPHRVLVPLCGKTNDLSWLAARGHEVVGVELARAAIEQFHQEHDRQFRIREHEAGASYESAGLTVHCRDMLGLTPASVGTFDRIWDRAAMVALDPERRRLYVGVLRSLLRPGGQLLLNAFSYDQSQMPGPPHSVPEDEIRAHYDGLPVEVIRRGEPLTEGKFRDRGVTEWRVSLYRVTRPG